MKISQLTYSLPLLALLGCGGPAEPPEVEVSTWHGGRQAAVSLTFDDGLPNQIALAAPSLEKHGFRGTFYLIGKTVEDWAPWRALAAKGHEIGSHTLSHPNLCDLHFDGVETQLSQSRQLIADSVGRAPFSLAYPYCVVPHDTDLVRRYYGAARICDGRIEPPTPADLATISSFGVGSESKDFPNAAPIGALIDSTIAQTGWLVLLIHEVGEGEGYSPYSASSLDSTLLHLADQESHVWTAPFANVAKYIIEREALRPSARLSSDADTIYIAVDCALGDLDTYDEPLTLATTLPAGWERARVTQDGNEVCNQVEGGRLLFDVRPGRGDVAVTRRR